MHSNYVFVLFSLIIFFYCQSLISILRLIFNTCLLYSINYTDSFSSLFLFPGGGVIQEAGCFVLLLGNFRPTAFVNSSLFIECSNTMRSCPARLDRSRKIPHIFLLRRETLDSGLKQNSWLQSRRGELINIFSEFY